MIVPGGSGWQTVLADLSLILFMVTATAVSEAPPEEPRPAIAPAPTALPALGEPVAVWRPGGPSLREWLASSYSDPRLRLTIVAAPADAAVAVALSAEAERPARIVLETGAVGMMAALTYDQAVPLAQGLQSQPAKEIAP